MSNGFMVDPIKPGNETTSGALNGGGYRNKQSANNFAVIAVTMLAIILFFVPFVGSFIFIKMVKEDFFEELSSSYPLNINEESYGLSGDEQRRIAHIWSLANIDTSSPTIVRGNCMALRQAATSYFSYNNRPLIWYDSNYCKAGSKVGIEADFANSDIEQDVSAFVLRLQNVEEGVKSCIEITLGGSFQEILSIEEVDACNSRAFTIDNNLDGYEDPRLSPQYNNPESIEEDTPPIQEG